MYKYLNNDDGNFAIISAIAAPLLLLLTGVAIDVSSSVSAKSSMQDQLDAALIAAILEESPSKQKTVAKNFLKSSYPDAKLKDFSSSEKDGQRKISARLLHKKPLLFGEILGQKKMKLNVTATVQAPTVISSIQIKLNTAHGWFTKTAMIKGTNISGNQETIASASYTYTHPNSSTFKLSDNGWIDVNNYSDLFIEFNIDPNSFGFPENCWLSGCPGTIFSTKQSLYSDRFFIDGVQQASNATIKFENTLECGQTTVHAWEDGGSNTPDFEYEVTARCETVNPGDIYIAN